MSKTDRRATPRGHRPATSCSVCSGCWRCARRMRGVTPRAFDEGSARRLRRRSAGRMQQRAIDPAGRRRGRGQCLGAGRTVVRHGQAGPVFPARRADLSLAGRLRERHARMHAPARHPEQGREPNHREPQRATHTTRWSNHHGANSLHQIKRVSQGCDSLPPAAGARIPCRSRSWAVRRRTQPPAAP